VSADNGSWLDLARKVDWTLSYVDEREAFPPEMSGSPWLPAAAWQGWDEPYRTTYGEYVTPSTTKRLRCWRFATRSARAKTSRSCRPPGGMR